MYFETFLGIIIPFVGTTLGALCVYFIKNEFSESLSYILNGFAAGVMIAA